MTRASDLAKLLGAGATINDGTTITTADNDPQLILTSTDADANRGPELHFVRDSASPADNDLCGTIKAFGKNSAGEDVQLGEIIFRNEDVTDGTEDGQIILNMMRNGASAQVMKLSSTETVLNGDSLDLDFRIESDNLTHALFVNGADGNVGIGTNVSGRADEGADRLTIADSGHSGMTIRSGTTHYGSINFSDATTGTGTYQGSIYYLHDTNKMVLANSGIDIMTILGTDVLIGLTTSNSSDEALQVYKNGNPALSVARQQDGTLVHLRVGSVNGATHGSIDISGTTCSYNAFSGSHWSRLSDNSKPTILKGTIIETIDEMCDWYQAEFTVPATDEEDEYTMSEPIALPSGKSVGDTITHTYEGTDYTATIVKEGDEKHVKCKISDTEDSKKVYGVHRSWDSDDDTVNDMYVTAVGTHVVRINKDVTVSAGDLLSSNGDGTAKVQDDDIIRSKTIGKVLTNIKQETYDDGSYTVPCALYCG